MKETENAISNTKPKRNSEFFAITSFICATIPYILFGIGSTISIFDNKVLAAIIYLIYAPFFMYPVAIVSVILGIKGLKTEARTFSYVALALNILPLIWLLGYWVIG